ncbi:cell surface glycoprotein 1-like [Dermatophagoides farinae]|nr:cell surface glycoprotein 1-like [Dermatophagoides farinae]
MSAINNDIDDQQQKQQPLTVNEKMDDDNDNNNNVQPIAEKDSSSSSKMNVEYECKIDKNDEIVDGKNVQIELENDDDGEKFVNLDLECEKIESLIQTLDQIELDSLPSVDDDRSEHDSINCANNNTMNVVVDDLKSVNNNDNFEVPQMLEIDEKIKNEETSSTVEKIVEIPKPRERKSKCLSINKIEQPIEIQSEKMSSSSTNKTKDYPDDLNPFGDDDDDDDTNVVEIHEPSGLKTVIKIEHYPADLNPFGDDIDSCKVEISKQNSSSLNPFGSDDEDEEPIVKSKILNHHSPEQRRSSLKPSPTPTSKRKKRPAPLPPSSLSNKSNQSLDQISMATDKPITQSESSQMYDSFISNASSSNVDFDTGSNVSFGSRHSIHSDTRTPTPVPRRSKIHSNHQDDDSQKSSISSTNNILIDSCGTAATGNGDSTNSVQAQLKAIKNKKRPAPPRPAFKRELKTSTEDMDKELNEIGDQLPVIEMERAQLEQWLLESLKTEEPQQQQQQQDPMDKNAKIIEYDQKLERFLELAREKCKLCRKQKELMYMKRELKLEETQLELEYQLRVIMSKQDAQKTTDDCDEEQRLLKKMMEIIDERNDIIENMIQDENKEIEEYQNMIGKVGGGLRKSQSNEIAMNDSKTNGKNYHLKPFHKLKKLNKKIKTKLKQHKKHQQNGDDGVQVNDDDDNDDGKSINESSESITSDGGPSLRTSTNDLSSNNCRSIEAVDDDKNSATKSKNLSKLGRTTLKKISNPSKTFHTVSSELKSKLQSHSNITNHNDK